MPLESSKPFSRIGIVGVGQVGGAAAYALILGSVASELLLVDVKIELRDAQIRDLTDVAYSRNSSTRVRAATLHEAGQCDVVVITAGSKHHLGTLIPCEKASYVLCGKHQAHIFVSRWNQHRHYLQEHLDCPEYSPRNEAV